MLSSSLLSSSTGAWLLGATAASRSSPASSSMLVLAGALTAPTRNFGTSAPAFKKSNRARGATRKSPRNAAIFASLSPRLAPKLSGAGAKKGGKKSANPLDEDQNRGLMTLEQACEELKAQGAAKRPKNAFEVHIVTTVSSHQTNALRGRIAFPKDPRLKQERLLVFAEEGSAAQKAVQQILDQESSSNATTPPSSAATTSSSDSAAPASSSASEASNDSSSNNGSSETASGPSIILGGAELISQVLNNRVTGFTKVLCTQNLLPEVSKGLARSLGPKGLMPNPRRGTVVSSDDASAILKAIQESRGAIDWRSDKVGVIRGAVGRLYFDQQDVRKNVTTLVDAIIQKVPTLGTSATSPSGSTSAAAASGGQAKEYNEKRQNRSPSELKKAAAIIKQVHLSSTQGPGIKLDLRDVLA